ncbi:MAG: glycosyltransferase family 4 protein [Rhodoferax sp.]|nr:glycosyltransferase family 4 protein [Rhodoferax sp.]
MEIKNCIMVCDSAAHSGGISAVMLQQATGLRAAGIRVYVFAAFGPADADLLQQAEGVVCMLQAHGERQRLREVWNRTAAQALQQFLAGFSATDTVVHIHALSMGLSPAIAQALRAEKMPYVITAHDAGWACPTGYFYHFGKAAPCALEPLSMACLASRCDKRSYLHKLYKVAKMVVLDHASHLKRDAAAIIVPSAVLQQRLRSRVPAATPLVTLLNPVNALDLGPRDSSGARFLFVGRIWEEKGILELLQTIGERYPLSVVGDGPRRAELALRYPQVRFLGWLPPQQVAQEMREALAVILPSVYLEAFGLVVAEALALGVPVVVSDRAGAATLVEQGVNGFVVDMAHPLQLLDSCSVLMDARRAASMSRQAYLRYWRKPLSTGVHVAGLLDVYRAIGVPAG